MALETVKEVNDPTFKTGMGKNGKQWTLAQVTTDKNNLTTVFAPVQVGDKLELTWNSEYGNWSAKKVNAQEVAQLEALRKLYELNLAIFKAVSGEDYANHTKVVPEPKPQPTPQPVAMPEEEEIPLDQIPF